MVDLDRLKEALADRYQLEGELGRGGMAAVYLAHDLKHDRKVALKVLHPELAATLGPERFQREIRTTARLQHPHILPVLDSGQVAGQVWYTMPFVEGESLRDRLRRECQLPIDDALQIAREVADALRYAHSQGIIHRDIKPENILLSHGHALVADFGVARGLQSAGGEQLTQTGSSVGTPAYMSPEQAMGDAAIDGRSDLYSLGCVLYEMLTGEAPYIGPSAQAITAKRLLDPVPSARRLRETVPPSVDQALQTLLAKAPADRFPTAEAFARALTTTLRGGPQATAAEVGERSGTHRSRAPAIFGVMLLFTALGAVVWYRFHVTAWRSALTTNVAGPRRLAVLPFDNLGDSADAYFADGITDAVRDKLTSIAGLEVIASTSSGRYRHTTEPPRRIGEELGVRYLLVGKVRWAKQSGSASRVQVRPELIDATTGTERWGDAYDAALTDVFRLQADLATKVAAALRLRLAPSTEHIVATSSTADPTAYNLYLKGRYYSYKNTRPDRERAVRYFREAIQQDSSFALAYAGLSDGLAFLTDFLPTNEIAPVREQARAAALRAVALDSTLADAYVSLADIQYWFDWDWAAASESLRRALAFNPNNALAHRWLVDILTIFQRHAEAIAEAQRAENLDPINPLMISGTVVAYTMARQYDHAMEAVTRLLELDPNSPAARSWLGLLQLEQGRQSVALATLKEVAGQANGDVRAILPLAYCRAVLGQREEARRLLRRSEQMVEGRPVLSNQFAAVYAALGERDSAFSWLDRGFRVHDPGVMLLSSDPFFDVLRNDRRFSELLHRMRVPGESKGDGSNSTR